MGRGLVEVPTRFDYGRGCYSNTALLHIIVVDDDDEMMMVYLLLLL